MSIIKINKSINTLIKALIIILLIIFSIIIINKKIISNIEPNQNMCKKIIDYRENSNYLNRDDLYRGWVLLSDPWVKYITPTYNNIVGIGYYNKIYETSYDSNNKTWKVINSCCVSQIQRYGRYIYGLGTNKKIYSCKKNYFSNSYGPWRLVTPNGAVTQFIIYNSRIYGVGTNAYVYKHDIFGGNWSLYAKGYVKSITIFSNIMYGIGTNNAVYKINMVHKRVRDNNYFFPDNILNYNWEYLNSCCVKQIQVYSSNFDDIYIYGLGTNNLIYRFKIDSTYLQGNKLSEWEIFTSDKQILQFFIRNGYIYGIGTDNRVYRHIINIPRNSCENFDNIGGKVDFKLLNDIK